MIDRQLDFSKRCKTISALIGLVSQMCCKEAGGHSIATLEWKYLVSSFLGMRSHNTVNTHLDNSHSIKYFS